MSNTPELTPNDSVTSLADEKDRRAGNLLARFREFVNIIGPTTVITAFLVYFGYIGTRARFEYFGVYLDMVNLSTQDLLLNGVEVVYIPAVLMALVAFAAVTAHAIVSWLLTSNALVVTWSIVGVMAVVGTLLMGRALVGILVPHVADTESPPGQTPLALALSPVLLAYALWITVRLLLGSSRQFVTTPAEKQLRFSRTDLLRAFIEWCATPSAQVVRRTGLITVSAIFIAGMFWAVNSFAWGFGAGRAYADALRLENRPQVLLETRERLLNLPPEVVEIKLRPVEDTAFRYRYSDLRLLVESGGMLFLVPKNWTSESRTIIVPYNDAVGIQLAPAPTS